MGCCGGDDGDLLDQLVLPESDANTYFDHNSSPSASSSAEEVVISPMNSNFSALVSKDLLRAILELLPPQDLARSACVCRLWRAVASEREMRERAFRSPWKVRRVLGDPSSALFWNHPRLDRFAISHCLRRGDTVAGLALRYSVQVMGIKRLNNMMSDHGIYSRERLLIPVVKPELLLNSTCYIEFDEQAKREVAVLYLEGGPDVKTNNLTDSPAFTERGKRKILDSLRRSMQVDEETAEFYLSFSNGDPRAAMMHFSEDLRWERQKREHCLFS
ncbi:F-box protein At1g55000-like [Curcuma longa]|uniref:F-box protein At1g55000-like n=1 Tax=Curcuma longa TaxID=136217 RepID=UPI003D9EFA5C